MAPDRGRRLVHLRRHPHAAGPPRGPQHGQHGPGDRALRRRRSSGLHDLQGTTHRGAAGADVAEPRERGALGRGSALLHASRRRRDPHHGRGPRQPAERPLRPGRIDGDAAAGAPELPDPRAEPDPQDQGSHPRRADRADLFQAGDPRALPEQGLLRRRLPRRRGGGARLLRQVGLGADRRGGGADRRHHQVAVDVGAHRQHGQGGGPPQHRPGDDAREPEDRPRRVRSRPPRAGAPAERPAARRVVRPVLQGAGAARAGRPLRLGPRRERRAAGLHDDRSGDAAGRRAGARGRAGDDREALALQAPDAGPVPGRGRGRRQGRRPAALPAGRRGRDGSAVGRSPRHGRRPHLHREPLQPRRPGPPPAGLRVQAVRLRRGARSGPHPGEPDHRPRRAGRDAAGRLGPRGRAPRVERDDHSHRAAHVEQPRRGARLPDRRSREGNGGHRPAAVRGRSRGCRRSRSAPAKSRCSR